MHVSRKPVELFFDYCANVVREKDHILRAFHILVAPHFERRVQNQWDFQEEGLGKEKSKRSTGKPTESYFFLIGAPSMKRERDRHSQRGIGEEYKIQTSIRSANGCDKITFDSDSDHPI